MIFIRNTQLVRFSTTRLMLLYVNVTLMDSVNIPERVSVALMGFKPNDLCHTQCSTNYHILSTLFKAGQNPE